MWKHCQWKQVVPTKFVVPDDSRRVEDAVQALMSKCKIQDPYNCQGNIVHNAWWIVYHALNCKLSTIGKYNKFDVNTHGDPQLQKEVEEADDNSDTDSGPGKHIDIYAQEQPLGYWRLVVHPDIAGRKDFAEERLIEKAMLAALKNYKRSEEDPCLRKQVMFGIRWLDAGYLTFYRIWVDVSAVELLRRGGIPTHCTVAEKFDVFDYLGKDYPLGSAIKDESMDAVKRIAAIAVGFTVLMEASNLAFCDSDLSVVPQPIQPKHKNGIWQKAKAAAARMFT